MIRYCIQSFAFMWLLFAVPIITHGQPEQDQSIHSEIYNNGRDLFQTNCGSCHSIYRELQGPMLASITKKKSESWLVTFIRNSQDVIASGDEYANFLFHQYDRQVMPSFEQLSYDEIKSILIFIEQSSAMGNSTVLTHRDVDIGQSALRGRAIFRDQCQACHFVDRETYGPALGSVSKRKPREWLNKFIRNSTEVIDAGDPYANYMFEQFNEREMVPMPFLSDTDIDDVLNYIQTVSEVDETPGGEERLSQQSFTHPKPSSPRGEYITKYVFVTITVLLVVLFGSLLVRLFRYLTVE